jgi:amidase
MGELHYMSATEALAAFTARTLSPVELLDAVIARAEEVEPRLNAFNETHYEAARAAAKAAEARYAPGAAEPPRPLEGIPTAVKGEEPMTGHRWTMSSLTMKDEVADHTSVWIRRLEDAGAIVHARTTIPEFAMAYFCHTELDGITRNPWNPDFTPGGSSGGSAAAVAAGSTTLATGSDIAGSIRVPAAFCGIVGFKPPYGRIPMWAPFNLDTYCHVGPLTRTTADAIAMQNVVCGPHHADAATVRPKYVIDERLEDVRGMRIALSLDFGGSWPLDPEIRANTLAAAEALRGAGATVEEVDLVLDREEVQLAAALHFVPFFDWVEEMTSNDEPIADYLLHLAETLRERAAGTGVTAGLEIEASIQERINGFLHHHDALLCPSTGTRGLVAGDGYVGHGLAVGGEDVDFYWDAQMTVPFNINSRCPVVNVPTGLCDNGVPSGMQIVGRTFEDTVPFRIGAALEKERPWLDVPERRPGVIAAR